MPKPRVNTNPVASAYAAPNEQIIEFSASQSTDGGSSLAGGLISILENEDGSLVVDLGRLENTTVRVGHES